MTSEYTDVVRNEIEAAVERADYTVIFHGQMLQQLLGRNGIDATVEDVLDACDELVANDELVFIGSDERFGPNYVSTEASTEDVERLMEEFEYDGG